MLQKTIILCAIFFFLPAGAALGATIYVPDDQPTIQDAINAALSDDVVIVRAGTYVENIDFAGKNLFVRSEDGPEATVLDGGGIDTVVRFVNGESSAACLDGFTVTNGTTTITGAGICIENASPVISNNIIHGNTATTVWSGGGGISAYNSSALISQNTIYNNTAEYQGGGILCNYGGFPVIDGNDIHGNDADWGGGICSHSADSRITNNIVKSNSAAAGAGIQASHFNGLIAQNVLFDNNSAHQGAGIHFGGDGTFTVADNLIFNNTAGWSGGGINLDQNIFPTLTNNTI